MSTSPATANQLASQFTRTLWSNVTENGASNLKDEGHSASVVQSWRNLCQMSKKCQDFNGFVQGIMISLWERRGGSGNIFLDMASPYDPNEQWLFGEMISDKKAIITMYGGRSNPPVQARISHFIFLLDRLIRVLYEEYNNIRNDESMPGEVLALLQEQVDMYDPGQTNRVVSMLEAIDNPQKRKRKRQHAPAYHPQAAADTSSNGKKATKSTKSSDASNKASFDDSYELRLARCLAFGAYRTRKFLVKYGYTKPVNGVKMTAKCTANVVTGTAKSSLAIVVGSYQAAGTAVVTTRRSVRKGAQAMLNGAANILAGAAEKLSDKNSTMQQS